MYYIHTYFKLSMSNEQPIENMMSVCEGAGEKESEGVRKSAQ